MAIKRNDFLYILISLFLSAALIVVIGNHDTSLGLYIFLGLTAIIVVMAVVIKPSLGASILIIAIYTNISSLLTDNGYPGIIKPLVVVIFAAIMVRNYYTGQLPKSRTKTAQIEQFLIIYLIVVTISYLMAANKDRALNGILDLAKDIGIIYTVLFALRRPGDWKQAIWVVILTTAFLSLFGIYQVLTGNYAQDFFGLASYKIDVSTMRLSGPVGDPNMWGQIVVAVIPLVVFRIIHEPRRITKLFGIGILGILLMEFFNTYSRGAYLALVVVALLVMFVFEKSFDFKFALIFLGVFILIIPIIPSTYRDRFATLASLSPATENGIYQDTSFRGRNSELLTGFSMFVTHPIFGVGVGNYPNNYQKYAQEIGIELRSEERDAHSLYVQIVAETGLLGLFAFLGIVGSLLVALSKTVKSIEHLPQYQTWYPWINALQVAILGYLVAAFFLHGAYIRYFWILVSLSMTAIQLTDEMQKKAKQSITQENNL